MHALYADVSNTCTCTAHCLTRTPCCRLPGTLLEQRELRRALEAAALQCQALLCAAHCLRRLLARLQPGLRLAHQRRQPGAVRWGGRLCGMTNDIDDEPARQTPVFGHCLCASRCGGSNTGVSTLSWGRLHSYLEVCSGVYSALHDTSAMALFLKHAPGDTAHGGNSGACAMAGARTDTAIASVHS